MDEKNVENLISTRHAQLDTIGSYISSFADGDFKPPASTSRNGLIGLVRAVEAVLSSSNVQPAINGLEALRIRMDAFNGGNPVDDLLIAPDKQMIVVGQIDNFKDALETQK